MKLNEIIEEELLAPDFFIDKDGDKYFLQVSGETKGSLFDIKEYDTKEKAIKDSWKCYNLSKDYKRRGVPPRGYVIKNDHYNKVYRVYFYNGDDIHNEFLSNYTKIAYARDMSWSHCYKRFLKGNYVKR